MWSENETNLATMVGLLEFDKEEIKKVPYKLHWQEVSARLEMRGRNKSKINVVCRHCRSVSLWEVQSLTRSVQILVEQFSRQLSNQADARVAFSDSILTARLTPGSKRQRSSDISTIKEKLLGPAHACTHSPTILSIQETKSWDMPNWNCLDMCVTVANQGSQRCWFLNSLAQLRDHGSLKRDVQQFSSEPLL